MKYIFTLLLICCCTLHSKYAIAQADIITNKPASNSGLKILPTGAGVFGVFDGRTPCQELAKQLKVTTTPSCIKIKWRVILYVDSVTQQPTTYTLAGFVYRNPPRQGKWVIVKGTHTNPRAAVIQLDPDKPQQSIYLLKADDNVLMFLDNNRNLMVGNEYFSYGLYRTVNKVK